MRLILLGTCLLTLCIQNSTARLLNTDAVVTLKSKISSQKAVSPPSGNFGFIHENYSFRSFQQHMSQAVHFSDVFREILEGCKMSHVAILSDEDTRSAEFSQVFLHAVTTPPLQIVHFTLSDTNSSDQLDALIHELHRIRGLQNFLLLTSKAGEVIQAAERNFRAEGGGSLMPNILKLFIFTSALAKKDIEAQVKISLMDHVTILEVSPETWCLESAHTLMWRHNRTRAFQEIDVNTLNSWDCGAFPNLKYGLNGRLLTTVTKSWLRDIIVVEDPATGQQRLAGYCIEVVNILSSYLNFTYLITVSPEQMPNMTWGEVMMKVMNREVDFAIAAWAVSLSYLLNISVTAPVKFMEFTGGYLRPPDKEMVSGDHFLVFKPLVFCCLFASFILVLCLYTVTTLVAKRHEETSNNSVDNEAKRDELRNESAPSSSTDTHYEAESSETVSETSNTKERNLDQNKRSPKNLSFIDVVFDFIGSMFNQGSLPRPLRTSTRFLLWTWSVLLLVMTTIYTGCLTASMVERQQPPLFSSYEQLLNSDYRWGLQSYQSLYSIMQDAKPGTLLARFYEGVQEFAAEDPNVLPADDRSLVPLVRAGKFVYLSSRDDLENVRHSGAVPELEIMKENLFESGNGFVLPYGSPLAHRFSEIIQRMAQNGLLQFFHRKWSRKRPKTSARRGQPPVIGLSYLTWTFYLLGLGLAVALMVIIGEVFFVWLLRCLHSFAPRD